MPCCRRFELRQIVFGWIWLLAAIACWLPPHRASGDEANDDAGQSVTHVSPGGTYAYVPNRWGILRLSLTNPTTEPVEILAASYFEDEPTLQFGRRVWIPPMSRLQSWHPILLPSKSTEGQQRYDFRTIVMDTAQKRELLIRSDSGALQIDGVLRALDGRLVVGLIDQMGESEAADSTAPNDLLLSAQNAAIQNGQTTYLTDRLLPAGEECLQSLDQLVIADSRVIDDEAGLAAIRRWLFGGGRLWVMLDRVDPRLLERLLGDEFQCHVVDRVGLTTVRLEDRSPNGSVARDTRDHERPVEFVRVLSSEVEVACTVDGWPAAFWKTCGEGRLLVTTMAATGWMRERTAADVVSLSRAGLPGSRQADRPRPPSPMEETSWQSPLVPLRTMQDLASEFFRARSEPRLPRSTLEPLVQEYVGYSIPARWHVIGLLMGFSGLLAALGVWLWRRSRLELLGVISPTLAISVSSILVWLGWQQRQSVPAAVASMQFVRAIPGSGDIRVEAVVGLFSPEVGVSMAGSKQGGWLMPDMTGMEGKTRRMVWTDLDAWRWENLPESAGLMNATVQQSSSLSERLEAHATFGPGGLSGRLQASAAHDRSDAVLATRDGRIGVDLRDDGTFVAPSNAVFTAEQFLGTALLTDEQHRRQRALIQLLNDPQRRDFPSEPQLLFWSKPWKLGFQFAQNRQTLGSALVSVPLKLQRPPPGTEVALAAPMLPYRETTGPGDLGTTGLWDHRRLEWQEKSVATASWLRFQIPSVLLPVAVLRGRLVIRVTGPVVRLEVAGLRPDLDRVVPMKTWSDPVGTLTLDLNDLEALSVTADGGLLLRVAAGDPKPVDLSTAMPDTEGKVSYWRIESLALELHVKTIEPQ